LTRSRGSLRRSSTGAAKAWATNLRHLAREGAHLALAAPERGRWSAGRESKRSAPRARPTTDVSDEASVQALVACTLATFGRIYILINAAGVTGPVESRCGR